MRLILPLTPVTSSASPIGPRGLFGSYLLPFLFALAALRSFFGGIFPPENSVTHEPRKAG